MRKRFFAVTISFLLSGTLFFFPAFFYLRSGLSGGQTAADKELYDIPYYEAPESCGLLFCLPDGNNILFYLDFTEEISYIINMGGLYAENGYKGFTADYLVKLDANTLSLLFDRLGGLPLESGGETLRYTGVQIQKMLGDAPDTNLRLDLVKSVCGRLSQNGFSDDDLIFLIDNSSTDLSFPVCINWSKYVTRLFSDTIFINWEF